MRKLQHDDKRYGAAVQPQATAVPIHILQRFTSWLGRAVGRGCAGGMWTISPEGKLRCEALRGDTCQTD